MSYPSPIVTPFISPDTDLSLARLLSSLRSTGGAIAIAIYGTIIQSHATRDIVPKVAAAAIQAGLPASQVEPFLGKAPLQKSWPVYTNICCHVVALTTGSAAGLASIPGITPAIIAAGAGAIKQVYSDAFRLVFLVSIAFGCEYT